jgi:fumarylacetoacetase
MSWIPQTAGSGFDVDNLPLGIFVADGRARPGVAIGAFVCDLDALVRGELLDEPALAGAQTLNAFLAAGRARWTALRARLQTLFTDATGEERAAIEEALIPRGDVRMHLPIAVRDYVDFYSSIEHATNVGKLFRPDNPILPNYRYVPIGYHGRASTIVIDGTPIPRPTGQRKAPDAEAPVVGPAQMLDFELELAFLTGGPDTLLGTPVPIDAVREHVYGYVLLDDWSARDIQAWEYQPLGPFLSKSFATSISPWVVSLDALEPFRVANRAIDPAPLPYLQPREGWAYDIALEVALQTAAMRARGAAAVTISRTNFRDMYWNVAQQFAHMTSNGSIVGAGDLFGTGTISGSEPGSYGSLIELTRRGAEPIALPNGETRAFLHDGDTVILRAVAANGERRVSFGEVTGTIV